MILSEPRHVHVLDLGLIDYQQAWDLQDRYFQRTIQQKIHNREEGNVSIPTQDYLLLCEHPHVYTLGKSGSKAHLLLDEDSLKQENATYYEINRGGDITYHGPGQLVAYPILDLDHFFTDIHKYLRFLEEAIILTLQDFGIVAGRVQGLTGVWVDFEDVSHTRKICAMGVRSSRWVTMHGLALNVNTSLQYFNHIVPCGIPDKAVTSMQQELGTEVDMVEVKQQLLVHLASLFQIKFQPLNPDFALA